MMRLITMMALAVGLCAGCAGNQPPDQVVLRQGTTVLGAATELQKLITASTDSGALPVPTAKTMTDAMGKVHTAGQKLGTAVQRYHVATTFDVKTATAAEVQAAIAEINGLLSELLKVQVPSGVATQIGALISNVMLAVNSVQAELAKGLGGS